MRTGFSSGNTAEYEYSADLRTIPGPERVRYWLSIVNPPDSVWGWDLSDDQNFARVRRSSSDPVNGPWEVYDFDAAFQLESTAGGLANISTRGWVGTDDDALIVGFIITGSDPTKVLIRALGPTLSALGVTGALADPIVTLYDSSGLTIDHNNDWKISLSVQGPEILATGLAPTDDRESAVIAKLNPNSSYTVVIHGLARGTGIAVAEVYDLNYGSVARLANISTRGLVQSGDGVMISGFIIRNPSGRVLARALGPSLQAFGVTNALGDSFLELRDSNGSLLASNDSWRSHQEAEIIATKAPPSHDLESAIVRDLPAGAYTGIIRDANGETGVGLLEVYNLDL